MSLEALADVLVPRDLCISPDGANMVYNLQHFNKKGQNVTCSNWIAEVGNEKSARQFTPGLFNDEQPHWSPDGTSVAFEEVHASNVKTSKKWIRNTNGRRGSALWNMRNVKTPILILHGENDVRVPLSQAIAFYRGCVRNNLPVEMVTYPREGHIIAERKHLIDMWKRMRHFYHTHLQ